MVPDSPYSNIPDPRAPFTSSSSLRPTRERVAVEHTWSRQVVIDKLLGGERDRPGGARPGSAPVQRGSMEARPYAEPAAFSPPVQPVAPAPPPRPKVPRRSVPI